MLGSRKLKTALCLLLCLIWQNVFAVDTRFFLILQRGEGWTYSYIGSVTIDDDLQALAAQIFLPGGVVFIQMDIQENGQTVHLQINPNGHTFVLTPMTAPLTSPFTRAVQTGSGNPSEWLAVHAPTHHQFELPDISGERRLVLNKEVKNSVGEVNVRFNKDLPPVLRNTGYAMGTLTLNPGKRTSGRQAAEIAEMSDQYLYQLIELMVVALIAPQLVKGEHFSSPFKRNPQRNLPLTIEESGRVRKWESVGQPWKSAGQPNQGPVQGYMLWVREAMGWFQQYVAGPLPVGVPNTPYGGQGTLETSEGPKACIIIPVMNPGMPAADPTVSHLVHQFGGMNVGTPPQNCRSGRDSRHDRNGFGDGPDRSGGAGGGFTTR